MIDGLSFPREIFIDNGKRRRVDNISYTQLFTDRLDERGCPYPLLALKGNNRPVAQSIDKLLCHCIDFVKIFDL